jgi:hypothetical protein
MAIICNTNGQTWEEFTKSSLNFPRKEFPRKESPSDLDEDNEPVALKHR